MNGGRFGPFGSPERAAPMAASSKLPMSERPTRLRAPGLRAAREAAGMTVEDVARLCGYGADTIRRMEAGDSYHIGEISRAASVIPGHDLRLIRGEGPGGPQVTRAADMLPEQQRAERDA